ncbi:MAG: glycosyltransferase family 2 protein [Magnetococcales bacterium]|nr:glycosyltransferase family 2 protein [Magnetococcales bacterium]
MNSAVEVSAILPCLNEERTLPLCIEKIWRSFRELGIAGEIVVGDNGSTDRSVEIAESMGARVVHQPVPGYGAALQAAIGGAKGRFIIMADADDSYDWSNLKPFIDKWREGCEFVMGNRFKGTIHPNAMPFLHKYVGNPVLSRISALFYNIPVYDFHCGMRGFTREAIDRMKPTTEGMEFATEMVIRAAREKVRMGEVPIDLFPDKRNRKPHLRTFRDGWRHLSFIMTYAPNYLYLVPGFFLFLCGLIFQALLIEGPSHLFGMFMGPHFLAMGLLFTLAGFNILNLGLIAKAVLVSQSPHLEDRLISWLRTHFSVDRGLLLGLVMMLTGFGIDLNLLVRWLEVDAPMGDSVHLSFVATGLVVLGLNVLFGSFLLGMVIKKRR